MPLPLSFAGRTLAVEAPPSVMGEIAAFFALCRADDVATGFTGRVDVREVATGRYALAIDGNLVTGDLTRGEVIAGISAEIAGHPTSAGTALRAAAVGWSGKAILILGPESAGKSALAAWFVEKGFSYRADDTVTLSPNATVAGFPAPLAFDPAKLGHLAGLSAFRQAPSVRAGDRMMICPHSTWLATPTFAECGLVIDVRCESGGSLFIEPLSTERTVARLMDSLRSPPDAQTASTLADMATRTPALRVAYGSYAQLDGLLDFLARVAVDANVVPAEFGEFLTRLPRSSAAREVHPVPARTERVLHPKLTIGMATYDDFDGTYFTVQAIRMYHPEVAEDVEFVVVDNNPSGPCAEPLKKLENAIPNYRYIPMPEATGTAGSRNRVFAEAQGKYVLCIDCHVFIVPGALKRLIDYLENEAGPRDLLQGPLLYDDLKSISTHLEPRWRAGFYGTWATKSEAFEVDAPPFEIELQGLGLFTCRKDAWPGFNPDFRGFGGEEGYIHEKIRRAGGRVLCLPFLRWMHRFPRPMGVPYPNIWEERIRNYLIGAQELGLSVAPMRDHFAELLGPTDIDRILAELAWPGTRSQDLD